MPAMRSCRRSKALRGVGRVMLVGRQTAERTWSGTASPSEVPVDAAAAGVMDVFNIVCHTFQLGVG